MKIKIDGDREVEVRAQECRYFKCLIVGYAVHRQQVGYSGCGARADKHLSCTYRHNLGCPMNPEHRSPEELHRCRPPRWTIRLRKPGPGRVRCMVCKQLMPRWLAFEQQEKARAERAAQEKARADAEGCATCEEKEREQGPPCMR